MAIEVLIVGDNRIFMTNTGNNSLADFEQETDGTFKVFVVHDLETASRCGQIRQNLSENYKAQWQALPRQTTLPKTFKREWLDEAMRE